MYAKVPKHLESPVVKELRGIRRRSAVKAFPLAILVVSGLVALVFFLKGHIVIEAARRVARLNIFDRQIVVGGLVLSAALGVVVAGLYVWQKCHECRYEECLYCSKCNAVDKYDSGTCRICQTELTERGAWFYTTDKEEEKAIERWGLQVCREC